MSDGSVAIGATVRAGFAGLGPSVRACWAALLAALTITVLAHGLPPAARGLAMIAELFAAVIAYGALYRRAFDRPSGFAGLRWGAEELRLLGAHLLVGLLLTVIAAVLLLVIGAIALGVARANAPTFDAVSADAWRAALSSAGAGTVLAGLAPLLGLGIMIWLAARLSLAGAATVDQGGVRVLSAFPLTRGIALAVVVSTALLAAPMALAMAVLSLLGRWAGPGFDGVLAIPAAALVYLYFAPVWTSALVHAYRRRMTPRASLSPDA